MLGMTNLTINALSHGGKNIHIYFIFHLLTENCSHIDTLESGKGVNFLQVHTFKVSYLKKVLSHL